MPAHGRHQFVLGQRVGDFLYENRLFDAALDFAGGVHAIEESVFGAVTDGTRIETGALGTRRLVQPLLLFVRIIIRVRIWPGTVRFLLGGP